MTPQPLVGIVMGSDSDWPVMQGAADALAAVTALDAGAKVHLYGKDVRPGRKLGHVTVTGSDLPDVRRRARAAAAVLRGDDVPAVPAAAPTPHDPRSTRTEETA